MKVFFRISRFGMVLILCTNFGVILTFHSVLSVFLKKIISLCSVFFLFCLFHFEFMNWVGFNIGKNYVCRSAYFKLIEECIAQIVLHRSGYDPDFRAKKFVIDVDGLTNLVVEKLRAADEKRNDELTVKLEEALTQKQEADARIEQLQQKVGVLEEAVKAGGLPKSFYDEARGNVGNALKVMPPPPPPMLPGGPPPPPPPPLPGMGGGGPPPPPPPPGMMMGGPPPPPPPPGMGGGPPPPPPPGLGNMLAGAPPPPMLPKINPENLPHGMRPKKKWTLEVPMKKANWKTV